jgi:hypothetical protein
MGVDSVYFKFGVIGTGRSRCISRIRCSVGVWRVCGGIPVPRNFQNTGCGMVTVRVQ